MQFDLSLKRWMRRLSCACSRCISSDRADVLPVLTTALACHSAAHGVRRLSLSRWQPYLAVVLLIAAPLLYDNGTGADLTPSDMHAGLRLVAAKQERLGMFTQAFLRRNSTPIGQSI